MSCDRPFRLPSPVRRLLTVVVLLGLASRASAETPFEAAMAGDVPPAERIGAVRDAAELGDPAARYVLSRMLAAGVGTAVDLEASRRWLLLAAGPARSAAQFDLGLRHLRGDGVRQDPERAALWLGEAARRGHAGAQVALAGLLARGDGVARDDEEARRWLSRAARRGSAEAAFRIAMELGLPAGEDWLRRSAAAGHAEANRRLGIELAAGGALATDEAAGLAALERAAEAGDATAMLLAGLFRADGRGGPVDEDRAYYWLRRAQLAGETRGAGRLAELERRLELGAKVTGDGAARQAASPSPVVAALANRTIPAAQRLGHGTGFWIGADTRYVITNAHVIEQCGEVRLEDGERLEVVASVDHVDLAVLRARAARPRGLMPAATVAVDDPVSAPQLDGGAVPGRIRALERPGHDARFFRFDARLERGASGGPVLDGAGRLAGVTVAKLTPGAAFRITGEAGEPAAFAIRGDVVAAFLDAHGVSVSYAEPAGETPPEGAIVRLECWF